MQSSSSYSTNALISLLASHLADSPDKILFRFLDDEMPITRQDFFSECEKFCAFFQEIGVQPDDRIVVQTPKSSKSLSLYIGAIMAGGIYIPLNPDFTDAEVSYYLNDSQPSVFICMSERKESLFKIAAESNVPNLYTLGIDNSGTLPQEIRTTNAIFIQEVARQDEDIAAILYTSGTTGRPKGAMIPHRALGSNAITLCAEWQYTEQDVLIHALPVFHTHGLFVATNVALVSGAEILFMDKFDVDKTIQSMPNATALMGVPTFYTRLLQHPALATASEKMRLFISGSAPLLAQTHEEWTQKTGHAILERYGMTEANMITSNPYFGNRKAGTVGIPLAGISVRITSEESLQEVAEGQVGSLELKGPNLFTGYWQNPEKTAAEFRADGYFISGDLACQDEDGYISIVGREKDLIISGGFNIYPKEIESILDELPDVIESAVVGVPHADFGEAVVAILIIEEKSTLKQSDVIDYVSSQLVNYKRPKHVAFLTSLPRNSMGKVQKNILREQYNSLFS
ncbi:MAG: AMP-binding protein [Kordiimonadaceae bacterium]|nr:AMP-binding protein [Kordiimonadaceae bacterium]